MWDMLGDLQMMIVKIMTMMMMMMMMMTGGKVASDRKILNVRTIFSEESLSPGGLVDGLMIHSPVTLDLLLGISRGLRLWRGPDGLFGWEVGSGRFVFDWFSDIP